MRALLLLALVAAIAACGDCQTGVPQIIDDGGSNGNGGEPLRAFGKVVAPDGTTPVAGVTVWIPGETASPVLPDGCPAPEEPYLVASCTNAQGNFDFELPSSIDLDTVVVTVRVRKGAFATEKVVGISLIGADAGVIVLPGGGEAKIAVVTGSYDRMQDILAKLGLGEVDDFGMLVLGTESFDLYNGDGSLPASYPGLDELGETYSDYDIVFLNCGVDESGIADGDVAASMRAYVENGGSIYVTDLAYDYVEQAFPEFIDFFGSDAVPAGEVEGWNDAQVGFSGITSDAEVLDPVLAEWLDGVSCAGGACRNTDGTVHVAGFLGGWAVMNGVHPAQAGNVKIWVRGFVTGDGVSGVRPLTVSFRVGQGQVLYSSYHTEEEEPSTGFRPQERILQYLIFELGG